MNQNFRAQLDRDYRRLFIRSFYQKFDVPVGWHKILLHALKEIDSEISDQDAAKFKWIEIAESRGQFLMMAKYPTHLNPWLNNLLSNVWHASADICQVCGQYATVQSESGVFCNLHRQRF